MNKPVISICIPTFNRAPFLKECLDSITKQFSDLEVKEKVNIFILDNQSKDNTQEIVKPFINSFDNIKYIIDDQDRRIVPGIIKTASLGNGEYLWVFSDDDLQHSNTLVTVLKFLEKNKTDLTICNLNAFSDISLKRRFDLLSIKDNLILENKSSFFKFINTKFRQNIDYYTTLCSNWIIKKEIFDKNNYIYSKFNSKYDLFPFPSLFFYTDIEYKTGIIAKQIISTRGDNELWRYKNKFKNFFYRNKFLKDFYKKIIQYNKDFLPSRFIFNCFLKNLLIIIDLFKIIIVDFIRKTKILKI